MNECKQRIREFFSRFFQHPDLRDSDDIFAGGFVNSLFAMQLIAWLENEYAVQVTDEDLQMSNFNSVNAISGLLARKSALRQSAELAPA